MTWNDHFLELFDRCVERYRGSDRDFTHYYGSRDTALLDHIGYRPREFFDFVEDYADEGTPSPSDALLVAAVRRDYFRVVMKGETRPPKVNRDSIPAFGDAIYGIPYLPRILAKARAKLRGELDPDLMYGCGGDRKFFRDHAPLHPADFLRQVWAAEDDDSKVVDWLRGER